MDDEGRRREATREGTRIRYLRTEKKDVRKEGKGNTRKREKGRKKKE